MIKSKAEKIERPLCPQLLNALLNYMFIHRLGWGYMGSPLATATTRWLYMLGLAVRCIVLVLRQWSTGRKLLVVCRSTSGSTARGSARWRCCAATSRSSATLGGSARSLGRCDASCFLPAQLIFHCGASCSPHSERTAAGSAKSADGDA
eukprot:SAG11_NODE_373_length_10031_cov_37.400020_6_plen_149_part_00